MGFLRNLFGKKREVEPDGTVHYTIKIDAVKNNIAQPEFKKLKELYKDIPDDHLWVLFGFSLAINEDQPSLQFGDIMNTVCQSYKNGTYYITKTSEKYCVCHEQPISGSQIDLPIKKLKQEQQNSDDKQLRCGNCGSEINHIFSSPEAKQILKVQIAKQYSGQGSSEEYTTTMKSLGGTCPTCGEISCADCYRKNGHKCAKCEGKIPQLAG